MFGFAVLAACNVALSFWQDRREAARDRRLDKTLDTISDQAMSTALRQQDFGGSQDRTVRDVDMDWRIVPSSKVVRLDWGTIRPEVEVFVEGSFYTDHFISGIPDRPSGFVRLVDHRTRIEVARSDAVPLARHRATQPTFFRFLVPRAQGDSEYEIHVKSSDFDLWSTAVASLVLEHQGRRARPQG